MEYRNVSLTNSKVIFILYSITKIYYLNPTTSQSNNSTNPSPHSNNPPHNHLTSHPPPPSNISSSHSPPTNSQISNPSSLPPTTPINEQARKLPSFRPYLHPMSKIQSKSAYNKINPPWTSKEFCQSLMASSKSSTRSKIYFKRSHNNSCRQEI